MTVLATTTVVDEVDVVVERSAPPELVRLIDQTLARNLADSFMSTVGVTADRVVVLMIDMDKLAEIVVADLQAQGTGAVAFAVGDFVIYTGPPGAEPPKGHTAITAIAPDGTVLGGGLVGPDVSAILDPLGVGVSLATLVDAVTVSEQ